MKRLELIPVCALGFGLMIGACGDDRGMNDDASDSGVTFTESNTEGTVSVSSSASDTDKLDTEMQTTGQSGCENVDVMCTDRIDLLFVIDNSGTMGEEQENLATNFPLLIERLENLTDSAGQAVNPNVNIMVTTSDFGNPLCTPFQPPDYMPAKGAPISSGCNSRIERFTGLGNNPLMVPQACTNTCPMDIEPSGDFINFSPNGSNCPDVPPADINGDGTDDSAIAQCLACIGPQGIDGCGYEAPLENMLQALNPSSAWNNGATPFLRDGALLAIAIISDEADCSVKNYDIMEDDAFMEIDPDTNMPSPSSAICWNAGVTCNGPDAMGVYSSCESIDNDNLQPVSRYTDYLIKELREKQKKEVIMLGILGVPEVTMHNPDPPFEPTAGGVDALVYRDWRDPDYANGGDILPAEWAMNVTAAHKQSDFGIGPGCTGEHPMGSGNFTGQAIPPVRIKEVCESLNLPGEDGIRCCIESICDDDFSPAIDCLTGIIQETIKPPA